MSRTVSASTAPIPGPSVADLAKAARAASRKLVLLPEATRNQALLAVATHLEENAAKILSANELDCRAGRELVSSGKMSAATFARLRLNERGIAEMALRLREVAALRDPLHHQLAVTELDEGLTLYKETCPLGVVAVVFESRPDVVPQVASLALKSGNAILLKGGAEGTHTNEALVALWKEALHQFPAIPENSLQLLHSRADVMELLQLERDVDLLIPRGGREFVEFISRNSRIPVLGHGEGICHVYVDRAADLTKAIAITLDSKVQYPAACNAAETSLVHRDVADKFLPPIVKKLIESGVEVRGCPRVCAIVSNAAVVPAKEHDWATEYGDLILSVKVVDDLDAAIEHIHRYGTAHTEAIVTEDAAAAARFLDEVDAAGVFHNASTRFADGYRYGLGSEVGISNGKLHARGPMGIEGLTTYKYKLVGNGHIVADYNNGTRKFRHKKLL
jgi:glutamate-5-semialdehyde dehydrogenase